MRRFLGSPLPKGGDRMERKYTVFLVEGDCFLDEEADVVRLDNLNEDDLNFLIAKASAQREKMDVVIRPYPAE